MSESFFGINLNFGKYSRFYINNEKEVAFCKWTFENWRC